MLLLFSFILIPGTNDKTLLIKSGKHFEPIKTSSNSIDD